MPLSTIFQFYCGYLRKPLTEVNFFFQKCTGPGLVSTMNLLVLKIVLLVLNIGMEEIKFVDHIIQC
jgi:hypothetical protein